MITEVTLAGCTPTPLASYLKALAVLRLLAEAGDANGGDAAATGYWRGETFVLRTRLDESELLQFFAEHYAPTPLIAPWNGGSGFYPKDNDDAPQSIARSTSPRFAAYRQALDVGRQMIARMALKERPDTERKPAFLTALRNQAPEALLAWIDAALILTEGGPSYPPLLGTGGNDGRLDFTNNFMQRLVELFDIENAGQARPAALEALRAALFSATAPVMADRAIGQFAPGAAGGPNSAAAFDGDARINPWDFVLMLEGAILFGASTARKLESGGAGVMIAPFTVRSRSGTGGGATAADDGDARGEIWMPLWQQPIGLLELRQLLSEGRAAVHGRPARDGLDFARAVASLGVDRGIASFQRYAFLMRSGKAYLATPLNRVPVRRNVDADLIAELEDNRWLPSVQQLAKDDRAPNAFRSAARQLDAALFTLAVDGGRGATQAVLRQIGRIEAALSLSPSAQEAIRSPLPRLSGQWALKAGAADADGNAGDTRPEFRIALALAGLRVRDDSGVRLPVRLHLQKVAVKSGRYYEWDPNSRVAVWAPGPLTQNLAALLQRRALEIEKTDGSAALLASTTGATLTDVAAFLDRKTDDARINDLLGGLACVDVGAQAIRAPRDEHPLSLPPAFALMKVFFIPAEQWWGEKRRCRPEWLAIDKPPGLPKDLVAKLAADQPSKALEIAWRRLRGLGAALPPGPPPQLPLVRGEGLRWLAALTIPLTDSAVKKLLQQLPFEVDKNQDSDVDSTSVDSTNV